MVMEQWSKKGKKELKYCKSVKSVRDNEYIKEDLRKKYMKNKKRTKRWWCPQG